MLIDDVNYPVQQFNGQRICGPPSNWRGPAPRQGTEVFVGSIPRFLREERLAPLFARVGRIYQFRLMVDYHGANRGFAFVRYAERGGAERAIAALNRFEVVPERFLAVHKSLDNRTLFVGKVPLDKNALEVKRKLQKYVTGIADVIMYPSRGGAAGRVNRGYVFVEFENHQAAAMARRVLAMRFNLWDEPVYVDWADPEPELDDVVLKKVSALFVRNVAAQTTTFDLREEVLRHIRPIGLRKVHKEHDYAFLHFHSHQDAETVLNILNGANLNGHVVDVAWARPAAYSKQYRMSDPPQHFCKSVSPQIRKYVHQRKGSRKRDRGENAKWFGPESNPRQLPPLNLERRGPTSAEMSAWAYNMVAVRYMSDSVHFSPSDDLQFEEFF